jgi:hypothetical protein
MAESSPGHIHERRVSPTNALRAAAQDLPANLSTSVPDLSGAIVLLPNLHASSALARALVLPRVFTPSTWCAQNMKPPCRYGKMKHPSRRVFRTRTRSKT